MKTPLVLALIFVSTVSAFSEFVKIEFSISPTVRGIPKEASLDFVRNAVVFKDSIPISAGKDLLSPFSTAQDLILKGNWLLQTGNFSDYRLHIGKPSGLSNDDLTLMTSDAIFKKQQEFLQKVTKFEPLFLIEKDPNKIFFLIYRLSGEGTSVIYIDSVIKNDNGSYSYYGGQMSSPEIIALWTGLVQEEITHKKCVLAKPK